MAELNQWQEAIGPLYTAEDLAAKGMLAYIKDPKLVALREMVGSPELVALRTTDGVALYPGGQFDLLPRGNLRIRRNVLTVWANVLAPAILGATVGEWRAGLMMFAKELDSGRSRADVLAEDEANVAEVTRSLQLELQELQ